MQGNKNTQKITKTPLEMQVPKATSSIRRLLPSLDIIYNKSLNSEVEN